MRDLWLRAHAPAPTGDDEDPDIEVIDVDKKLREMKARDGR